MIRFKLLLFALLFFVSGRSGAQNLLLRLDSVFDSHNHTTYRNLNSVLDTVSITSSDTLRVYGHLRNLSGSTLLGPSITFQAAYFIIVLPLSNFNYAPIPDTLPNGGTVGVEFYLYNPDTTPLPISPGGSSVVIWPICPATSPDSVTVFVKYYVAGNNEMVSLLNSVKYDQQNIFISVNSAGLKTLEWDDATGRRAYEHESSSAKDEIAWGDLPAGVYI